MGIGQMWKFCLLLPTLCTRCNSKYLLHKLSRNIVGWNKKDSFPNSALAWWFFHELLRLSLGSLEILLTLKAWDGGQSCEVESWCEIMHKPGDAFIRSLIIQEANKLCAHAHGPSVPSNCTAHEYELGGNNKFMSSFVWNLLKSYGPEQSS